jgi:cellobiose phosphorylase
MGNRTFARRLYLDGKPLGDTNLYLEPQIELLRWKEWNPERKQALYGEIKNRLMSGESVGARQVETPEWSHPPKGSGENGGVWYSLNGPLIQAVAIWDKAEAIRLLKQLCFEGQSAKHPACWSAWWAGADSVNSSLSSAAGFPPASDLAFPVGAAAPHAWILEAYQGLTAP